MFGRKIPHHLLHIKLQQLWDPTEQLVLIDLGWEFFIVKFAMEENMTCALHGGSWFVMSYFLSIQNGELNFVPMAMKI